MGIGSSAFNSRSIKILVRLVIPAIRGFADWPLILHQRIFHQRQLIDELSIEVTLATRFVVRLDQYVFAFDCQLLIRIAT